MSAIVEYRCGNPQFCFERREGKALDRANAEARMLELGCPAEMAGKAARAHEARRAKRITIDMIEEHRKTAPLTTGAGLCNLDLVRDDLNKARLADVAKLVDADKKAGRI